MLTRVYSSGLNGLETIPVEIEVDAGKGLTRTVVVGLPDEAARESKDRVKSALINSGYKFPTG